MRGIRLAGQSKPLLARGLTSSRDYLFKLLGTDAWDGLKEEVRSGRGRSTEVPSEVERRSKPPDSVFRVTGLAYHAWANRLREHPLPRMPLLDKLRTANFVDPSLVNRRVMEAMTDQDTLIGAFLSMYSRHGSIEEAHQALLIKGRSWLGVIADQLRRNRYEFGPIGDLEPKSNSMLKEDVMCDGIPLWWHKTIPEAMRMVLEAVFEPVFLKTSHGYRPEKGCFTALKEIKNNFESEDYFLVGDLSRCLEEFDKGFLMKEVAVKVVDEVFLSLLSTCIDKGYVDMAAVSYRNIGLPQTTLISPVLCNIYLHAMDCWFESLTRCLLVGGQPTEENEHQVLETRARWATDRIPDVGCWRSTTLTGVKYVRYGNNFLVGVSGGDEDISQLELDLLRFINTDLRLPYTQFLYNRAASDSPAKEYVVFLGTEIYMAPMISSPGTDLMSVEAQTLPLRPRLCIPARLIIRKLEEAGFVDPEMKRPKYVSRFIHWECHEIVKYYDVVMKSFMMYYTFADNYHCLALLYDVLKQSCSFTLGRKLGLKRMWHVHKRLEKNLVIRDMQGVALASFERPSFQRERSQFIGKDINPFLRIEWPSRPKFPAVKLGEAFVDPKFPMSNLELSLKMQNLKEH